MILLKSEKCVNDCEETEQSAEYLKGRVFTRLDARKRVSHLGKCQRAPIKKRPEPNFFKMEE